MTGIVAQLIALAAHGNNYLKKDILPEEFYPSNSTFQFCNRVDFREFHKPLFSLKAKEVIVAENPVKWFERLKNDKCKSLRLYFQYSKDEAIAKDYKLAGLVGGGGTWLIEAVYEGYSNYWANRWEVTNRDAADNRIWTVNYAVTAKKQITHNLQIEPAIVKEKLRKTLNDIADFAFKHDLGSWGEQFEHAQSALDENNPTTNQYHKDMIPPENYSLTARQVLSAAGAAWVFGGMGSWNDLSFESKEDNKLYDKLSEQLYSNVVEAFIASVNSY